MDELITRLRARAADPDRRVDVRPTQFSAHGQSLDLGGLLRSLSQIRSDLARSLEATREGRVDPESQARAEEIQAAMSTPVSSDLPSPADAKDLDAAEAALGFPLPPAIRRIYSEVADGGFGPGCGLLSLRDAVERYRELRTNEEMPRGRSWPQGLVPLVRRDPGWDCVEATTGRVIGWDPEELSERSSEERFQRSLRELSPSVESWLGDWVVARTPAELMAEQIAASQVEAAREARARIARMTPEERAQIGLPEVGWERVVWGGIGLDVEEEPGQEQ